MIISIQRLTLFALISAVEADAKRIISTFVISEKPLEKVYPEDVLKNARERQAKNAHLLVDPDEDSSTLDFMNLNEQFDVLQTQAEILSKNTSKLVRSNVDGFKKVVSIRNRVMHGRPLDFDDVPFVKGLCDNLTKSDPANWVGVKEMLKSLRRDPSHAFELEKDFELISNDRVLHNLPSPDFDDTGFVGREEQLSKLKRAIKGNFPVITVLGEGGFGKTSLTLKAIYDLLDELPEYFDAVIWTTAKANVLTPTEIKSIEGAIQDSLGVFSAAAASLGAVVSDDPVAAIREWLTNFRVLLIIDNLETILDERIRNFASEIPAGSKLLFTTRVSLGAYDFPIEVTQLPEREGVEYFKRVCEVYNLNELRMRDKKFIKETCARLNYSPLAIKWFVQAVRGGGKPASLLADPKLVLKFCIENVVDNLTPVSRQVLDALVVTARPQSVSSLHYILQQDSIELTNALRELRAANLVLVTPSPDSTGDDLYRVKQLANFYIRNYFAPAPDAQSKIRQKQSILSQARDRSRASAKITNIYNPNYIAIRPDYADSDYVVADYLESVMINLRKRRYEEAESFLAKAKDMSPNFFEVYRIEAFLAAQMDNTLRAESAYERAVSLNENYAPIRRWFGGFLIRIDQPERAKEQFEEAVRLDNENAIIKIELARACTRLRLFDEARKQLDKIDAGELTVRQKKMLTEIWLQFYRHSISASVNETDFDRAFELVKELSNFCIDVDISILDEKHALTLSRIVATIKRFSNEERGSERGVYADEVIETLSQMLQLTGVPASQPEMESAPTDKPQLDPGERIGTVQNIHLDKRFGFVREETGARWFFYRGELIPTDAFDTLKVGSTLRFYIGKNDKGSCAVRVKAV